MKHLLFTFLLLFTHLGSFSQIVVLDAGHGYLANCTNGDGRTSTEINTAHEVTIRLKNLITNNYCGWTVYLTRPNNGCNSWVSVTQRATMANNWNASLFLSVHCNASPATAYGTESFWCDQATTSNTGDKSYATKIQNSMATRGHWPNRRVVEDNTYLAYHLGVLKTLNSRGCLNEIGFVTTSDSVKLLNTAWRDSFALGYFEALQTQLGKKCFGYLCDKAKPLTCGQKFTGTSSTELSTKSVYGCNSWTHTGPERVHKVVLSQSGAIAATLENASSNLDVYILSSKNTANCVGTVYSSAAIYNNAPAGTYYVVVDGQNGSGGSYDLIVNCEKKADLGHAAFTATKVAGYARRYNAVDDVYNYGGLDASFIDMGYYLSTDNLYSSNDILLNNNLVPNLAPVSKYTNTRTLDVPSNVSNGNYYILAFADNSAEILESNETNNVRAVAVTISNTPDPFAKTTSEEPHSEIPELEPLVSKNRIKIYPNPVNQTLFVEMGESYVNGHVYIYDLQGRLISSTKNNTDFCTIDMTKIPQGVYLVQVENGLFTEYHKIIKQ